MNQARHLDCLLNFLDQDFFFASFESCFPCAEVESRQCSICPSGTKSKAQAGSCTQCPQGKASDAVSDVQTTGGHGVLQTTMWINSEDSKPRIAKKSETLFVIPLIQTCAVVFPRPQHFLNVTFIYLHDLSWLSPQTEADSSEVDHLHDRSALPIPAVAIAVVREGMHQAQTDLAPWHFFLRWVKTYEITLWIPLVI